MSQGFFDFKVPSIDGSPDLLGPLKGQVVLAVNVASRCGYTPQYEGLERLWRSYGTRGLVVLGFPCNQFGAQEPGNDAEIGEFCRMTYDVSFPMFAKVDVNGANTHPVFALLKSAAPGLLGTEAIKWNFTKFLIDRTGRVVARYAPARSPDEIAGDIEKLL